MKWTLGQFTESKKEYSIQASHRTSCSATPGSHDQQDIMCPLGDPTIAWGSDHCMTRLQPWLISMFPRARVVKKISDWCFLVMCQTLVKGAGFVTK